jgi:predicted transcriptional regulator
MLGVMRDKKLVCRRKVKRGYEWSALVSRQDTARGLVGQLLDRVFDGSARRLVAHLVDAGDLSADELGDLKAMLGRAPSATRRK